MSLVREKFKKNTGATYGQKNTNPKRPTIRHFANRRRHRLTMSPVLCKRLRPVDTKRVYTLVVAYTASRGKTDWPHLKLVVHEYTVSVNGGKTVVKLLSFK